MWRSTVLTIFPEMFPGPLGTSLAGKALASGLWSLDAVDIRGYATDKHRTVDDTPAGGGPGMVMKADVLARAIDASASDSRPRLLMSEDELAQVRYRASIEPGFQEAFGSMFPSPRQRWVDAMATPEDEIRKLPHSTLIVHGRDDQVIPVDNAFRLLNLIDRSQVHIFGRCGHWTQIEHAKAFNQLLLNFLA